jgi:branched-chain amino acid transport system permease protein
MDWMEILDATLRAGVGRNAIIYAIAAVGLNLQFGYTGLLNFGHVGFMAVGAYGTAVSVNELEIPLWAGVFVGLGAAMVLALLLGLPTLRLRAEYLAIVTIAVGEIFRLVVQAPAMREVTGGSTGISGYGGGFFDLNPLPADGPSTSAQWIMLGIWAALVAGTAAAALLLRHSQRTAVKVLVIGSAIGVAAGMFARGGYGFGPWRYSARSTWILLVGWTTVLIAMGFVALLTRSPWGRVLKAVREDEDAARALGKNAYGYKVQSLVIGGGIGAAAGIFWAVAQGALTPGLFKPETTFFVYVALFLGGVARTFGPVVGSMLLWMLISVTEGVLSQAIDAGHIPTSVMEGAQVGQVRLMLVGLGMAGLVIFRPQGIFGDRREVALEVP